MTLTAINNSRYADMIGSRFGRLLVLELTKQKGERAKLRCACDCGNEVVRLAVLVSSGVTRSCGCLRAQVTAQRHLVHGMNKTPTHNSWTAAKQRCFSETFPKYPSWGGKGITMCDRWRDSFENFLADMGERPAGTTLEREDGTRGYEPGNCVWATAEVQAQNRPSIVKLDHDKVRSIRARYSAGERVVRIAADFGISEGCAYGVISRKTWKNVK